MNKQDLHKLNSLSKDKWGFTFGPPSHFTETGAWRPNRDDISTAYRIPKKIDIRKGIIEY